MRPHHVVLLTSLANEFIVQHVNVKSKVARSNPPSTSHPEPNEPARCAST